MADQPGSGGIGVGLNPLNPSTGEQVTVPLLPAVVAPPKPAPPPPEPAPPEEPAPPLEPAGPQSIPDSFDLFGWIVSLGLIALLAALLEFFKWFNRFTLGNPPRRIPSDDLTPQIFGQALSNSLGKAVQTKDNQIGAAFTQLSQDVTRVGQVILDAARAIWLLERRILRLRVQTGNVQATANQAVGQARTANQAAAQNRAHTATEAARAKTSEQSLEEQVHVLHEHITRVLEPELESLRKQIPTLHRGQLDLWDEVKQHSEALGIAGVTAATGVALARLGAQWARCESNQVIGSALCQSNPDNWRKLLHGLIDVLGIAELCTMLRLVVDAGKDPVILEGLGLFSTGVEDLLKCTGATKPTPLHVAAPDVGPAQPFATLAP